MNEREIRRPLRMALFAANVPGLFCFVSEKIGSPNPTKLNCVVCDSFILRNERNEETEGKVAISKSFMIQSMSLYSLKQGCFSLEFALVCYRQHGERQRTERRMWNIN